MEITLLVLLFQNGKYFEEFEPLEDRGDGYINSLGHFLRKRNF